MIARQAAPYLLELVQQFKAVAVVGPRQAGKTTLARHLFADRPYVSLENPDVRLFATEDPRGFLGQYPEGAILDEIQRVPHLFSYLQQILDEIRYPGRFILSGSNHFLLQENISQSLAGRVAYCQLLPFSYTELQTSGKAPASLNEALYTGGYPPLYDQPIRPENWFPNYLRTYVERDVRQLKNISDLASFERFVRLCAGRVGQLLNINSLAVETGVDNKTIQSWLSVLESSFLIFLVRPYHQNFNKRLIKSPKLYFHDTGLAAALLGIRQVDQLALHPLRGSLFENWAVTEVLKAKWNQGHDQPLYFWRDQTGNELDLLVEKNGHPHPVEIKSGETIQSSFWKGIEYWQKITQQQQGGTVIYGGVIAQHRSNGFTAIPWHQIGDWVLEQT